MIDDDGLIAAFRLDGKGGGEEMDWASVHAATDAGETVWIHLDRNSEGAQAWLNGRSGVDPVIAGALMAEETRPRSFSTASGLFMVLRGVNLNPGANPEDMVSLRVWLEENRIVTVRVRRLMAVSDIAERIKEGRGPAGAGDFLAMVTDRLIERMGPAIGDIGEALDDLETSMADSEPTDARQRLLALRHQAVILRRYLAPQREALGRIQMEKLPWLHQGHKMEVREVTDRTTRYVEDLDEIRERSMILQDELLNEVTIDMNRKVYVLTVIAAIVLPLSFITGLFGINVGGVPLAETKNGFWIVTGALAVVGAFEIMFLRLVKWI
ncbi:MAG: zinc transporter ZntB [Magnetovibrio sp.]|nr:zinc transporter ZntB [Magnetovibrio sp.]